MRGNKDELISAALRSGVSDALIDQVNIDLIAGRGRRRFLPRGNPVSDAIGERFVDQRAHERVGPATRRPYRVDVDGFGADILQALNGQCVGYVVRLQEPGAPGLTFQSGLARAAGEGDAGWNPEVRQHVASVSKLITAMAVVKALDDAGVRGDDSIAPYLPTYWKQGSGIADVTFHRLLTHTSGFANPQSDDAVFGELKAQIARGTYFSPPQPKPYQNTNFAMFRILLATLTGAVAPSLQVAGMPEEATDRLWDQLTIRAYEDYVKQHVFGPAGVVDPTLASAPGYALGYRFPMASSGWDAGDLSSMAATISWHLSAFELVRVLEAFESDGSIVPPARAEEALKAGWGIDQSRTNPAGRWYLKGGRWESGANQLLQAVAGILPGRLQLAVLVNSQIGPADRSLINLVGDTIDANVVPLL
ncbi:serine hydrolase domain-containing protein [Microbacterium sulfonylureivorans]|uniref:serine hydrolase domain-containing protein n=1 Tax=Microbacterium sulfonylureivorans TaxID=2486854 RepID=UPI000FDB1E54|nr:serine hydrolase domain-containing protein [Microbacterium sulfonylureivorans]